MPTTPDTPICWAGDHELPPDTALPNGAHIEQTDRRASSAPDLSPSPSPGAEPVEHEARRVRTVRWGDITLTYEGPDDIPAPDLRATWSDASDDVDTSAVLAALGDGGEAWWGESYRWVRFGPHHSAEAFVFSRLVQPGETGQ